MLALAMRYSGGVLIAFDDGGLQLNLAFEATSVSLAILCGVGV